MIFPVVSNIRACSSMNACARGKHESVNETSADGTSKKVRAVARPAWHVPFGWLRPPWEKVERGQEP